LLRSRILLGPRTGDNTRYIAILQRLGLETDSFASSTSRLSGLEIA
jgi:hypothetical protein